MTTTSKIAAMALPRDESCIGPEPTHVDVPLRKKKYKTVPRTDVLASPRNLKPPAPEAYRNKVKPDALLYEITDRTNQLAQPRKIKEIVGDIMVVPKGSKSSTISERLIELSRPRKITVPPKRNPCFVSPHALTAVATERIIELSKPRITVKKSKKVQKRKSHDGPCENRLDILSRPRNANPSRAEKLRRNVRGALAQLQQVHRNVDAKFSDSDRSIVILARSKTKNVTVKPKRKVKKRKSKKIRRYESEIILKPPQEI